MNEYDSNRILDLFKKIGYTRTENISETNCYVLNTCHIREKATDKVYHDVGRLKKEFRNKKKPILLVTGCVAQAEGEEMLKKESYIDGVFGPQSYHKIPKIINKIEIEKSRINNTEFDVIEKFDNLKHVVLRKMSTIIQRDWSWRVQKRTTGEKVTMLSDSFGLISLLIIVTIASTLTSLSIEGLLILILLFGRLRAYTAEYQTQWVLVKEHRAGTIQLLEAMRRLATNNVGHQTSINTIEGILLDNVSFSFDQDLILNSLSATISKGDRILLTGKSGDGKSTLLKIIAGYYLPDEGIVTINHHLASKSTTINAKLTDHIFYASNEMYIPNTTLKNFIDPESTMDIDKIKQVLKEACLEEILEQHNVLDEPMGDNAGNFSLGQRQRLLLARAYLQSPSVVILDEATSNLDPATEKQVLSNFMSHLSPSTILIISAHHSPPVIEFNKEYKLSEAGIIESVI